MNALTDNLLSAAAISKCRRALDLVYALVNEGNIKQLTKELLDYLKISDAEFKPDLTSKICQLVQRFAPDKRWHFDSTLQVLSSFLPETLLHPGVDGSEGKGLTAVSILLQVLVQAGAYAKEEVCRTLVVLISNEAPLHGYAARQSFRALQNSPDEASLLLQTTATWFLGVTFPTCFTSELVSASRAAHCHLEGSQSRWGCRVSRVPREPGCGSLLHLL